MTPIIEPSELIELQNKDSLVIVCAGSGEKDNERFSQDHLHGSVYADLNKDLSKIGPDPAIGGRHPLPPVEEFGATVGRLGIDYHSYVVIYDYNHGANAAARLWWMLRAIGHEKVRVLNGGPEAAVNAGFPHDNLPETPEKKLPYAATEWLLPVVTMDEAEKIAASPYDMLIDVRSRERYEGFSEPIDLVAGHIPGAVNIPLANNTDESGFFLPPGELRELYQSAPEGRTVIHCGSGVTACHTILAMDYAGMSMPALYVGSWSEWSRSGKEIATKK